MPEARITSLFPVLLVLVLFFFPRSTKAQKWAHLTVNQGFLLAHTTKIVHLQKGYASALQIGMIQKSDCKNCWQAYLRNPLESTNLRIQGYGYREVLGTSIALNRCIDLYLIKKEKAFTTIQMGAGLSYFSRYYDPQSNFENNANGSAFNANLLLQLRQLFELNNGALIAFSTGLYHSSNASVAQPNLGLNVPSLSFMYAQRIADQGFKDAEEPEVESPYLSVYGGLGVGRKQVGGPDGEFYNVISLISFAKIGNKAASLLIGADVMLNPERSDAEERTFASLSPPELGLNIGAALNFKRSFASIQTGYYLARPPGMRHRIYHRVGIQFQPINAPVLLGLHLKWHQLRADYAEISLGYRFSRQ